MPADARLLFRAAVASTSAQDSFDGIKNRFASYHPKTRALRCTACDYLAIKHESLWASHAASKSHRLNVSRIKKEEEEKLARHRALEEDLSKTDGIGEISTNNNKRKGQESATSSNPNDESLKRLRSISGEDKQTGAGDAEWERFQREVLNVASTSNGQPSLSRYANATIEVAPSLRPGVKRIETEEEVAVDDYEEDLATYNKLETGAERKARLEREDREEIIARLEEEQRLQDEADERVNALKSRFERLKQARASKKR